MVKTRKTELLFLALFLRMLQVGPVIVPEGVLFGSSNAHKVLRKLLVETHKLGTAVSLPSEAFSFVPASPPPSSSSPGPA